ncbi:cysteine hydrolase [Streptomyces sp. NBC_00365]|uniref:cysteine hydrolase n=1 Tax=Streptomyces sp. NBC_00365 TaxID=2975726 RepID=UPI00224CA3BF|nr:cysteine hydrolase [Streptomyces sp. NBC_00365]MCX5093961.1 cysteine hydrolase [Streptomyces sp. NBC_00365]
MTEFDPARTAVINIHWQYDIVTPEGAFGPFFAEGVQRHGVIAKNQLLTRAARAVGTSVIHVRTAFRPGYTDLIINCPLLALVEERKALLDGTRGADLIEELSPEPGELVITHTRLTGFHGTDLNGILRGKGIDTVVFSGVATDHAVQGTAREAVNHSYRSLIVSDACSAANDETHQAALDTFTLLGEIVTTQDVEAAFSR